MFSGEIRLKSDYYSIQDFDTIMSLIHKFKMDFDISINKIITTDEYIHIVFEGIEIQLLKSKGVTGFSTLVIATSKDINTFNKIYNYFEKHLTDFDFLNGDEVFYNREHGVICSVLDDKYIEIKFDNDEIRTERKCWCKRFM